MYKNAKRQAFSKNSLDYSGLASVQDLRMTITWLFIPIHCPCTKGVCPRKQNGAVAAAAVTVLSLGNCWNLHRKVK